MFGPWQWLPALRVPEISTVKYIPWTVRRHRLTNLLILSCDTRTLSLHEIFLFFRYYSWKIYILLLRTKEKNYMRIITACMIFSDQKVSNSCTAPNQESRCVVFTMCGEGIRSKRRAASGGMLGSKARLSAEPPRSMSSWRWQVLNTHTCLLSSILNLWLNQNVSTLSKTTYSLRVRQPRRWIFLPASDTRRDVYEKKYKKLLCAVNNIVLQCSSNDQIFVLFIPFTWVG